MAWIKLIFTTIPGIVKLLGMIKDTWDRYQRHKVSKHYQKKKKAVKYLTEKLKNAQSDKERQEISELLGVINSDFSN